jgi:hypothetical protein
MATVRETEFRLPILKESTLKRYLKTALGVVIPDVQVCPEHTTPWRAFADAYFARHPMVVWKGSRGFGGKTFSLGALGLTEALTLAADVNILGGSGQQSERVHAAMARFWAHPSAPTFALSRHGEPIKRETKLDNGGTILALMASSTSVRGPHPQRLRCDEVDEMDLEVLDAALGQTMRGTEPRNMGVETQTVLSSTHQYPNGTMKEILDRAKKKGWPVYEWCYKETCLPHGWLDPEEVARKKSEISDAMWLREYELQSPTTEMLAIAPEKLAAMFRRDLGVYQGYLGEYIEIEEPVYGGAYAHGADWAAKSDMTVVVTMRFDVLPARIVAFQRMNRRPWPEMVALLDERQRRMRGMAFHDGTGLGDVVDGYLKEPAEAFVFGGKSRTDLLSDYIVAIEHGQVEAPMIEYMYDEHANASVDDVFGSGHLPDTFAAGALAWKAVKEGSGAFRSASQADAPEEDPWIDSRI